MATLDRNLHNRAWLVERLRSEIVGPDPATTGISLSAAGEAFFSWEDFRKPKRQANGDEILWQDSPTKRYGAGILYPNGLTELMQLAEEAKTTSNSNDDQEPGPDIRVDEQQEKKIQQEASRISENQSPDTQ